ncbi:hypothetical protein, partial [Paraburkholderia sp. BR10879]
MAGLVPQTGVFTASPAMATSGSTTSTTDGRDARLARLPVAAPPWDEDAGDLGWPANCTGRLARRSFVGGLSTVLVSVNIASEVGSKLLLPTALALISLTINFPSDIAVSGACDVARSGASDFDVKTAVWVMRDDTGIITRALLKGSVAVSKGVGTRNVDMVSIA